MDSGVAEFKSNEKNEITDDGSNMDNNNLKIIHVFPLPQICFKM